MKIGIVGTGKVGTTLGIAFGRCGHNVMSASSRQPEFAQRVADEADILFLTVSDDAVGDVASRIRWRAGVGAIHCSGSLELAVLATAKAQNARIASFHPLQMFADIPSALENLAKTTIVLEGDDTLLDQLESVARQIKATPLRLHIENRGLYHASVNYAGPFVIALLREAVKLWAHLGLTEEQTLRALVPLIGGTLGGVQASGLAAGMGGAVARGDIRTIERHIRALKKSAPDQLDLYSALCERTIPLALERGTLKQEVGRRIEELLVSAKCDR